MSEQIQHPGEQVKQIITARGASFSEAARRLNITVATLSRMLAGKAAISAEMAVRLEAAGVGTARQWSELQAGYDIATARQKTDVSGVIPL